MFEVLQTPAPPLFKCPPLAPYLLLLHDAAKVIQVSDQLLLSVQFVAGHGQPLLKFTKLLLKLGHFIASSRQVLEANFTSLLNLYNISVTKLNKQNK